VDADVAELQVLSISALGGRSGEACLSFSLSLDDRLSVALLEGGVLGSLAVLFSRDALLSALLSAPSISARLAASIFSREFRLSASLSIS